MLFWCVRILKSFWETTVMLIAAATVAVCVWWSILSLWNPCLCPESQAQLPHPPFPWIQQQDNTDWEDSTQNFYMDPEFSYSIERQPIIRDWDRKRLQWLKSHPQWEWESQHSRRPRILLVSGSQPEPCTTAKGDHFLVRAFKNKQDYCRLHGLDLFYNRVLLNPKMAGVWAKIAVIRAAMAGHPEAEWIWWVDSDAVITDMKFELPLEKYSGFNLVLHGWRDQLLKNRTWVNSGVFLIRNCEWSLQFLHRWASMSPQVPLSDSDDQSALLLLMIMEESIWFNNIYLENSYYFNGDWVEIVGGLENLKRRHDEIQASKGGMMRFAEKSWRSQGESMEGSSKERGVDDGILPRRPFVTHFNGCQFCNSNANDTQTDGIAQECWDGMEKAMDFAEDQILHIYGFKLSTLKSFQAEPILSVLSI